MKENRLLIAAIIFLIAVVAEFWLAFTGNNPVTRIFDGIVFSVGMFLALRGWKKQRENNDDRSTNYEFDKMNREIENGEIE